MKMRMRILSIIVCLALLMSATPVDLRLSAGSAEEAEAVEVALEEAEVEAPETETPPAEESAEPEAAEGDGQAASPEPVPEDAQPDDASEEAADAEPEAGEPSEDAGDAEAEPPVVADAIDYTADAGASPAFATGFAEVIRDGAAVYAGAGADAEIKVELGRGAVYANGRSFDGADRISILFNAGSERGLDRGWVDAAALRPMEPEEEVPAFAAQCEGQKGVLYIAELGGLPLPGISCTYPEDDGKVEVQTEEVNIETSAEQEALEEEHPVISYEQPEDGGISTMPLPLEEPLVQLEDVLPEAEEPEAEEVEVAAEEGDLIADSFTDTIEDAMLAAAQPEVVLRAGTLKLGVGESYDLLGTGFVRCVAEEGVRTRLSYTVIPDDSEEGASAPVSVSDDGMVFAVKGGSATVMVTETESGANAELTVEVLANAKSVSMRDRMTLGVGMTGDLGVTFPEGNYSVYTLSCAPEGVVELDQMGKVTGIQAGETTVTLRTGNGLVETCFVRVVESEEVSIALESYEITIALDDEGIRIVAAAYAGGEEIPCDFRFEVTDGGAYVSVDAETGVLTPKSFGTATVTVSADGAEPVECSVTVAPAPGSIVLRTETLKLGVGETYQISDGEGGIIVLTPGSHITSYRFSSDNTKAVTVDRATGLLTAKAAGSAIITIQPSGMNDPQFLEVVVSKAATSIQLNPSEVTLLPGELAEVKVSFPSGGYSSYELSFPTLSDVDPDEAPAALIHESGDTWTIQASEEIEEGMVLPLVARTVNGASFSGIVKLLVGPSEEEIEVELTKPVLGIGETGGRVVARVADGALAETEFTYTSSEPKTLAVDGEGNLTAYSVGSATITVTATVPGPGGRASVTTEPITVVSSPTGLQFSTGEKTHTLRMGVGDSYPLCLGAEGGDPDGLVEIIPNGARSEYVYSVTSGGGNASVSADGVITAKKAGTMKLSIWPEGNPNNLDHLTLTVTVSKMAGSVSLDRSSVRISTGMDAQPLQVSFPSGTYARYSATSSNERAVRLHQSGETIFLEPVAAGKATITVRTEGNGSADTCLVTVVDSDEGLVFDAPLRIGVGEAGRKVSAAFAGEPLDAKISFHSNNAGVLDVDPETGELTAKRTGAATIGAYLNYKGDGTDVAAASQKIDVVDAPGAGGITLSPSAITLHVDEVYAIRDGDDGMIKLNKDTSASYTFKSSAPKVASVSAAGEVKGLKAGSAEITIQAQNGTTAVLDVAVVKDFSLTSSTKELGVGMSGKLTVPASISKAATVSCFSDPEGAVEFSEDGSFTAKQAGSVAVYAEAVSGETKKVSNAVMLNVLPAPDEEEILFTQESVEHVAASQEGAKVIAVCAPGTMAELGYRLREGAPTGVYVDSATGALTIGGRGTGTSFFVEAYDKNHPEVFAAREVAIVPPSSLAGLRSTTLNLMVGEKYQLSDGENGIILLVKEDAAGSFKYSSSSTGVAAVSKTGLITAKKAGTAKITITDAADSKNKVVLTVKVVKKTDAVTLTPAMLLLGEGMTGALTPSSGTLELSSSDEAVATVDAVGNVHAVGVGDATITALSIENGNTDTAHVRVVEKPEGVELEQSAIVMGKGEKNMKAAAHIIPAAGSEAVGTVRYELADSEYASYVTVNATTGAIATKNDKKSPATFDFAVRAYIEEYPELEAEMAVTVVKSTAVSLTVKTIKLAVGNTYQLSDYDEEDPSSSGIVKLTPPEARDSTTYSYKSSSAGVASVDADGLITAKKSGSAKITISTQSSRSATLTVQVYEKPDSITLNSSNLELCEGMTSTLKVSFPKKNKKETYDSYSFFSEDEEVASVDPATGVVTAVGAGETIVAARTVNGLTAYCRVAVAPVTGEIHLTLQRGGQSIELSDGDSLDLGVGEKNLKLVATPEEGHGGSFRFKLEEGSPTNKLTVNATSGALNPKATTDDPIRVVAYEENHEDEITATISVNVLKKPAKSADLTLSPTAIRLGVGETFQITEDSGDGAGMIQLDEGYAASYTFKSNNTKIVTVSATGLITAVGKGSAKVRISTQNTSAYRDLTVKVGLKPTGIQIPATLQLGSGMTAELTPSFAPTDGFGFLEAEVIGGGGMLDASVDPGTGKIALTAGTVVKRTTATLVARLPETGLTDTCLVTLLPAPQAGEVAFDYENMPCAVYERGEWIIRVGKSEKGATLIAKCTGEAMSGFTYAAVSDGGKGLTVNAETGALTVSSSATGRYTVTATSISNPGAVATGTVEIVNAPTAVYFHTADNPKATSYTLLLGVGEQYQLKEYRKDPATGEESGILVLDPAGTSASYTFAASAKSNATATTKVVSVDKNTGVITAKQEGTAYVKATTQNSKYRIMTVKVVPAPEEVELVASESEIGENSSGRISLKFTPENSSSQVLSWVSSNPELLKIGEDGFFETGELRPNGVAETVTITATTRSGHIARTTVKVLPHPAEVGFAQERYEVSEGMRIATAPGTFPAGQKAQKFSYRSENPEYATIDPVTGEVTGVLEGSATITITANPGKSYAVSGTATVEVLPRPVKLSYEGMDLPEVLKIAKGDAVQIPQPVAYSASGTKVTANYSYKLVNASADKAYLGIDGDTMTGLKALPAKNKDIVVRVSVYDDADVYIDLKVRVYDEAPGSVEIYFEGKKVNGTTIPMYVNAVHATDSIKLSAKVTGANINYGALKLSSSEPSLVKVDADGTVTVSCGADGKAPSGNAKVYVEAGSILEQCTIQVGELCDNPTLRTASLLMQEGEGTKIDIGYAPTGSGMRLRFTSENEKVASVDGSGLVTAVSGGETTIAIAGQYGWSGEVQVQVLYDPDNIQLPVCKLYMNAGDTLEITPELSRTDAGKAIDAAKLNLTTSAKSSYSGVVRVDQAAPADQEGGRPASYTLTAVARGSAKVTFASRDGKMQAVCEIEVDKAGAKSGFGWDSDLDLYLIVGDTAELEYGLTTEAYNLHDFSVEAAPGSEKLVEMQGDGSVKALAKGTATLQLTAGGEALDSVQIHIIDPIAPKLWYGPELKSPVLSKLNLDVGIEGRDPGNHTIRIEKLPAPKYNEHCLLLGTYEVNIEDPSILEFDATTDQIHTKESIGKTTVSVRTFGSAPKTVEVSVMEATNYRALMISEYDAYDGRKSDLPFTGMNVQNMNAAMRRSNIDGKTYDTKVLRNPSQSTIRSTIQNFFADTKENDISLLYVVAHGHMGTGSAAGQYCFSLGSYVPKTESTYVTDTELMTWIKAYIKGKVILVIDSCNSGGFISHQKSVGGLTDSGNIAVLTAQMKSKNASFYKGPYQSIETYEFFTRAFHIGVGYQTNAGSGDFWNNAGNADADGDGMVTVQEIFNHTKKMTTEMVNKYCNDKYFKANLSTGFKSPGLSTRAKAVSWYNNGNSQIPQMHIPTAMKDLVFFGLPN